MKGLESVSIPADVIGDLKMDMSAERSRLRRLLVYVQNAVSASIDDTGANNFATINPSGREYVMDFSRIYTLLHSPPLHSV